MTAVAAASRVRSVNPATLDVVWEAPVAGADDVALAVGAAGAAQRAWRRATAADTQVAAVVATGNAAVLKGGLELLYRKGPGARGRGAAARREGLAHLTRRYLGRD